MGTVFTLPTMKIIKNTLKKDNTHEIALLMFDENIKGMFSKVLVSVIMASLTDMFVYTICVYNKTNDLQMISHSRMPPLVICLVLGYLRY